MHQFCSLNSGSFQTSSISNKRINIQGEGLTYIWTKQALGRAGYVIVENAEMVIQVHPSGNIWSVIFESKEIKYASIYDLVKGITTDFCM